MLRRYLTWQNLYAVMGKSRAMKIAVPMTRRLSDPSDQVADDRSPRWLNRNHKVRCGDPKHASFITDEMISVRVPIENGKGV